MVDDWPRDEPLILEGIRARRGGVEVLRGIDLEFPPTSRTVVIGPSGSGKSTLLRLLNRLADPIAGVIRIGSRPIASVPVTRLRRKIGLVFQAPRPLPGTVGENLAFPRGLEPRRGVRGAEPTPHPALPLKGGGFPESPPPLRGRVRVGGEPGGSTSDAEALREVGLDPSWLDRDAAGLSGGERQRLALAVALQTDPAILALDEPTSALDPASARVVADLLRERSRSDGLTTIAVTHNREQAAWLGDWAVVLDAGQIVDHGPVGEVLARANEALWASGSGGGR